MDDLQKTLDMLTSQRCATGKLNSIFKSELLAFQSGLEVAPVSIDQELRAGVIGWIATFAPEAINTEARDHLSDVVRSVRERPDFRTFGWYRIPFLEVARFSLTRNLDSLSNVIANIDHHQSTLRSAMHPPLGLVAPKLGLDDTELLSRIESCLKGGLFFSESLMCILSVLRGDKKRKLELVKKWRREIDLAPQDAKLLDSVVRDDILSNSLIVSELFLTLRYLFCRLLDPNLTEIYTERQLDLFPHWKIHAIWTRMYEHPLLEPTILFERTCEAAESS